MIRRVFRTTTFILLALFTTACTSLMDGVQNKVEQMLASKFTSLFTSGIDAVINGLSAEGGFLDDPVVRILLPPPLGLALGVARDLQRDPKAALLESLINHAAEGAIPVAGPILKDMVMKMDTTKLQTLLDEPDAAVTEYLMEEGGAAVKSVLLPAVTQQLRANGAVQLYGELLAAQQKVEEVAPTEPADVLAPVVEEALPPLDAKALPNPEGVKAVSPEQLGDYVAEQAVGGLFKKVATQELAVRDTVNKMVEVPF